MLDSRPRRDGPSIGPPLRGRADSRAFRAFALLAAGALLGACGGAGDSPAAAPPSAAATPAVAPARRVVSLAPSHTELLFALGAGDAVVGVTRFCDRPAEAKSRTVVGDATRLSLETLAALNPDLIVLNAEATAAALGPMRERVRVLPVPTDTLPQLLDAVDVLGAAVGRTERAHALRASMEKALDEARRRNGKRPRTRVLLVVQHDPFFVAGGGSYVDSLLRAIGCENAAGDLSQAWPSVSAEALLTRAPDAVIDAALGPTGRGGDDAAVREWWGRYPMLPAVKEGRVRALRDEAALRPGPDLAGALRALEESVGPAPGSEGAR
jgi:iron complex transport system substrate-binding protein